MNNLAHPLLSLHATDFERPDYGHACHIHRFSNAVDCMSCAIRQASVCGAMEPQDVAEFESLARSVSFAHRAQLFMQDDVLDSVYNITEGVVRLYRLLQDGRRQVIGFAIPGDFLGLSMTERFAFSADALTPVTVCRFNRDAFTTFVDTRSHVLRKLYDMAGHELTLAQDQMVIIGRRSAEERVVCFLIGLRKRLARYKDISVTIPLPMTRQDIADYLGLTIETVSRTISKLAREKALVVVPDGVRLLDLPRLEAMAAG